MPASLPAVPPGYAISVPGITTVGGAGGAVTFSRSRIRFQPARREFTGLTGEAKMKAFVMHNVIKLLITFSGPAA
jgi:hypothetical protein